MIYGTIFPSLVHYKRIQKYISPETVFKAYLLK